MNALQHLLCAKEEKGYKRQKRVFCIVSSALQDFWIKEMAPVHLGKMGMDEDVWLKYIVCNGDENHKHGIVMEMKTIYTGLNSVISIYLVNRACVKVWAFNFKF